MTEPNLEIERMVESRFKHRRRPPAVFRGPENDDDVRRSRFIDVRLPVDLVHRKHEVRTDQDAGDEESPPDPALEAAVADLSDGGHPRLAPGESDGAGPATVSEVRTWASADYTRVAIYLSHWVGWQKLELAPEGGHPRRLALDLRPATLTGKALERAVSGDRVDGVRAAQNDAQTVRVVLDLPGQDHVQLFSLDDPPRLVLGAIAGLKTVEFARSREKAGCCGAGGALLHTYPDLAKEISARRWQEARGVSAEVIASASPSCEHMLEQSGDGQMPVIDLLEVVARSLQ